MKINIDEVNYIARLAKLRFTQEEAQRLTEEFQSILTHFESIDKIDLRDVTLDIYSEDLKPVFRSDEARVFEDKVKLFQNVKSMQDTAIAVPKIIE